MDRDGEADPLGGRRIHADDRARGVEERTAAVALVDRGIGLDGARELSERVANCRNRVALRETR